MVLVDMPMPKSCKECRIYHFVKNVSSKPANTCPLTGFPIYSECRNFYCPIIQEVPYRKTMTN